jgi:hypothetical protein
MPRTTVTSVVLLHDKVHTLFELVKPTGNCTLRCLNTLHTAPTFRCLLIGSLKDALRKPPIHQWRRNEDTYILASVNLIFSQSTQKLVHPWTKYIEKEGNYVVKWCSCTFYIDVALILRTLWILSDSHTYSFIS